MSRFKRKPSSPTLSAKCASSSSCLRRLLLSATQSCSPNLRKRPLLVFSSSNNWRRCSTRPSSSCTSPAKINQSPCCLSPSFNWLMPGRALMRIRSPSGHTHCSRSPSNTCNSLSTCKASCGSSSCHSWPSVSAWAKAGQAASTQSRVSASAARSRLACRALPSCSPSTLAKPTPGLNQLLWASGRTSNCKRRPSCNGNKCAYRVASAGTQSRWLANSGKSE